MLSVFFLESWSKLRTQYKSPISRYGAIHSKDKTAVRPSRRSSDRLVFIMGIPILVRRKLYVETTTLHPNPPQPTPFGYLANIAFIFDAAAEQYTHLSDKYERYLNIVITLSPIVHTFLCMDIGFVSFNRFEYRKYYIIRYLRGSLQFYVSWWMALGILRVWYVYLGNGWSYTIRGLWLQKWVSRAWLRDRPVAHIADQLHQFHIPQCTIL